jgi:hypothetical protein
MQDVVHFHGTCRYATRESLEHAIASARAVLADDDSGDSDAAWMRCFVTRGTVLTVNLTSRVETAVVGAVEARLGEAAVDVFPSGDDD